MEAILTEDSFICKDEGNPKQKTNEGSLLLSVDNLNWSTVAGLEYIDGAVDEVSPLAFESNKSEVITLELKHALPTSITDESGELNCVIQNASSTSVPAVFEENKRVKCQMPHTESGRYSLFLQLTSSNSTVFISDLYSLDTPRLDSTQPLMLVRGLPDQQLHMYGANFKQSEYHSVKIEMVTQELAGNVKSTL